jgi:hypothetical protein
MMIPSWLFILSRSFHERVRRGKDKIIWIFFLSSKGRGSHLMAEKEKCVIDKNFQTKVHLVAQSVNGQLKINPLNAELNPSCHLLILLGDLTYKDSCIVSIFQYTYISNKMQRYTVYLYLETSLDVSGGSSTHHQERIQLYLQHLVFVTTQLLLSAVIVEELEPV